jgi:hypothetical protein
MVQWGLFIWREASEMGRPTEYNEEKTIFLTEKYLEEYKQLGELIPSVAGLALYLGVSRSTVQLWATQKEKKAFSGMLEKIKARQELLLLSGGLGGTMNAQITKLVLSQHGYSDKVDNVSSDGSMSPKAPVVLEDFYAKSES